MPEPQTLRIEYPCLPPAEFAVNRRAGKSHWSVADAKAQALELTGIALNQAGWHPGVPPIQKATVSVHFWLPTKRRIDHSALVERMKPLFDALTPPSTYQRGGRTVEKQGYGVIADDDLATIGFPSYSYEYRPRQPGTSIEIQEA